MAYSCCFNDSYGCGNNLGNTMISSSGVHPNFNNFNNCIRTEPNGNYTSDQAIYNYCPVGHSSLPCCTGRHYNNYDYVLTRVVSSPNLATDSSLCTCQKNFKQLKLIPKERCPFLPYEEDQTVYPKIPLYTIVPPQPALNRTCCNQQTEYNAKNHVCSKCCLPSPEMKLCECEKHLKPPAEKYLLILTKANLTKSMNNYTQTSSATIRDEKEKGMKTCQCKRKPSIPTAKIPLLQQEGMPTCQCKRQHSTLTTKNPLLQHEAMKTSQCKCKLSVPTFNQNKATSQTRCKDLYQLDKINISSNTKESCAFYKNDVSIVRPDSICHQMKCNNETEAKPPYCYLQKDACDIHLDNANMNFGQRFRIEDLPLLKIESFDNFYLTNNYRDSCENRLDDYYQLNKSNNNRKMAKIAITGKLGSRQQNDTTSDPASPYVFIPISISEATRQNGGNDKLLQNLEVTVPTNKIPISQIKNLSQTTPKVQKLLQNKPSGSMQSMPININKNTSQFKVNIVFKRYPSKAGKYCQNYVSCN